MTLRHTIVLLMFAALVCSGGELRLSPKSDYQKYIDPLLAVEDFGMHYSDDGAADATVLFPSSESTPYARPKDAVVALVRLGTKSLPLLIDCLSDIRLTSAGFDGSTITRPMHVPVGYVCLDVLMAITRGQPISDPECASDGLGACMNYGFYFRPDDYSQCWDSLRECEARPWVGVVQDHWRRAFLQKKLRFRNPYDEIKIPEYSDFTTGKK